MSTVSGNFQACADGSHAASITCSGSSCAQLKLIPSLACTTSASGVTTCVSNTSTCLKNANLTNSFSIQSNGLAVTQTHNVTVRSETIQIAGSGANFKIIRLQREVQHIQLGPQASSSWNSSAFFSLLHKLLQILHQTLLELRAPLWMCLAQSSIH